MSDDPLAPASATGTRRRSPPASPSPRPTALATATPDGRPSVRIVLLQGHRRARAAVLHQLREPQGPRAGRQPARRARAVLAAAAAPGAARGPGRAADAGGVRRLLRLARRAARGSAPGRRAQGTVIPRPRVCSRRALARARRAVPGDEVPRPAYWGGFRLRPGRDRVLAGPPEPAARPPHSSCCVTGPGPSRGSRPRSEAALRGQGAIASGDDGTPQPLPLLPRRRPRGDGVYRSAFDGELTLSTFGASGMYQDPAEAELVMRLPARGPRTAWLLTGSRHAEPHGVPGRARASAYSRERRRRAGAARLRGHSLVERRRGDRPAREGAVGRHLRHVRRPPSASPGVVNIAGSPRGIANYACAARSTPVVAELAAGSPNSKPARVEPWRRLVRAAR